MPAVKNKPQNEPQQQLLTKCNKEACKLQYAPSFKPNGKRAINKPNQAKSPPTLNVNKRKKKADVPKVPSYIRTEMEILNRLQQVNRNLKALIKPKCRCDHTARKHKCCQPARERRDQRKAQVIKTDSKGDTNTSSAADRDTEQTELAVQSRAQEITETQQAEGEQQHKCSCSKKCEAAVQAKSARGFQRLLQCMKPKGQRTKCVNCKCAQNNKHALQENGDAGKTQANETANAKVFHTKCGHHRCKKHVIGTPKQDGKDTAKTRRKHAPQQATATKKPWKAGKAEKALKDDKAPTKQTEMQPKKATKKTGLGSYFKCCNKEKSPAQKDDENTPKKVDLAAHKSKTHTTIVIGEKLRSCMRFFRPRGKRENQQLARPSALELKKQYEARKSMHEQNKRDARRDVLTTLVLFPNPSNVHLKYVDNVQEYKLREANRRRMQEIEERELRKAKAPTDTPSTSSLEEYFQKISERMALAQKEADARPSVKQPNRRTYAKRNRAPQSSGPQLGYRHR